MKTAPAVACPIATTNSAVTMVVAATVASAREVRRVSTTSVSETANPLALRNGEPRKSVEATAAAAPVANARRGLTASRISPFASQVVLPSAPEKSVVPMVAVEFVASAPLESSVPTGSASLPVSPTAIRISDFPSSAARTAAAARAERAPRGQRAMRPSASVSNPAFQTVRARPAATMVAVEVAAPAPPARPASITSAPVPTLAPTCWIAPCWNAISTSCAQ